LLEFDARAAPIAQLLRSLNGVKPLPSTTRFG